MILENPEQKDQLLTRLRRIEGQLRGVQNMISEERDCKEILQQLASIRSATQGATMAILESYLTVCMLEHPAEDQLQREQLMSELLFLLGKAPA